MTLINQLSDMSPRGRYFLLFCAGTLATLALAPFFWWPVLPISYGALFLMLQLAASPRQAFYVGWWWGFGFFLAGLYWICISMTVDLPRFGWMIPFALFGMNGGLALFTGLSVWLYHRLRRANLWQNLLLFTACFMLGETARSHLFTGFPWNLIGYSWGAGLASLQMAAVLPILPLSALTLLLATLPACGLFMKKYRLLSLWGSAALLLLCIGLGYLRLTERQNAPAKILAVRLVQPNIAQAMKWQPEQAQASLATHLQLSQTGLTQKTDWIIWPESALPYTVDKAVGLPPQALSWLAPHQRLIAGGVMKEQKADGTFRYFNSLMVFDKTGAVIAHYNKRHLVPFGEYVPLRGILPIERLAPGLGDFALGNEDAPLHIGGVRAQALICYESIFSRYSTPSLPANLLINITNDAWFGRSSGPHQHAAMARFRAVEQGLPLLRVANTGITVIYDGQGRVLSGISANNADVLDDDLPILQP